MGIVGEACLPSNAYCPRTPDYTLYSGIHVCWSEHSDSSFVYGVVSLDYGWYYAADYMPSCQPNHCWWLCFTLEVHDGGSGLTICLWLGPPWFNYWFSFTLAYSRISYEYSSLFILVVKLIFCVFALMHWLSLEPLCEPNFYVFLY